MTDDQTTTVRPGREVFPLHILYLIDEMLALSAGGTERQILQMAQLMLQEGHHVEICVLRGTEWLSEKVAGVPVHFADLGSFRTLSGWRALFNLLRWMGSRRFDVIQTFFVESNLLGPVLGRMAGIPVVLGSRRNLNYWMTRRTAFFQRLSNMLTTRLVANCVAVKDVIAEMEGTSPRKIDVLYNGVDLAAFTPDAEERKRVRQQFGVAGEQIVIGCISTLRPVKGTEVFVEAAAIVSRAFPAARFVLVGDGPLRAKLEAMVEERGLTQKFFFAGSQDDVRKYLRAFDIAVLASESEGFSNSILEYMAMGLPSVVTDVGGNKEALGDSGLLVPPGNSGALADALLRLVQSNEERSVLSRASLAHAAKFSLGDTRRALSHYYRTLRARK